MYRPTNLCNKKTMIINNIKIIYISLKKMYLDIIYIANSIHSGHIGNHGRVYLCTKKNNGGVATTPALINKYKNR